MDAPARIATFLRIAGLESLSGREAAVERAVRDLLEAMGEKVHIGDPGSLYTYQVPMLTEDGTCSIVDELAPVPYDLTAILGGRSDQTTRRLSLLGEHFRHCPPHVDGAFHRGRQRAHEREHALQLHAKSNRLG